MYVVQRSWHELISFTEDTSVTQIIYPKLTVNSKTS